MRYIVESSASTIHDTLQLKGKCREDLRDVIKDTCNLAEMQELIRKAGYDLCEHCFGEE